MSRRKALPRSRRTAPAGRKEFGPDLHPDQVVAAGWHPLAAAYHYGTRDVRWLRDAEYDAFARGQRARARVDPAPSPYKETKGPRLVLPGAPPAGPFVDVLRGRRTWRGFGPESVTREQLGSLLDLTFGAQMTGVTATGRRILFKTSPSGGACHPIEGYVLALRVAGVRRGLYHYSPRTGDLSLVRRGASAAQAVAFLGGQRWCGGAAVIVFMSAVLPRVWWRYDHPRSYRALLLEAGHVCQTFCLAATWLGLAPFCTMAFDDRRIERALRIDGVNEILLYAAGAGSRPADGRWVQWPGNTPDVLPAPRAGRRPTG